MPGETGDATALWFEAKARCALRTAALPPRQEGELTVRALFSGISRGTEALVFNGQVPESEFERMRAPYQDGDMPFPVKYGYAAVGIVEEGPAEIRGRAIFALHPHQDRFRIRTDDARLLPERLPAERAVLAANMETALNIVWDAGIMPGDRVAVYGAGVVGLLTAYIASRIAATDTAVCDTSPARRPVAEALGLSFCVPADVPQNCDVLINASASPAALESALDHAGFEARIVEASWYGEKRAEIPLGRAFHARRLSIISSQVGAIAANRRARWDYARRMSKALELLCDDRLDALISGETPFSSIADAYPGVLASPDTLCHRIRY
jgi:NADPH:quinone reductase-like Zn-dependent oxidoreductase